MPDLLVTLVLKYVVSARPYKTIVALKQTRVDLEYLFILRHSSQKLIKIGRISYKVFQSRVESSYASLKFVDNIDSCKKTRYDPP